ncbi:hypothetical protein LSTR_LSTR008196 [Laodelphax striatellus]|uniref:Uncharacterized protein n=1 Tax=Laodelphax striatellus TaxID=195883 RepID=A0A482WJP1_LAOST|nr:hypothetical protein LSTR_LSTR008196 [Laodelphax striatellus]
MNRFNTEIRDDNSFYYSQESFQEKASGSSDASVTEKIHDLKYQLYISMGVCITGFIILLFAIVMMYTLLERYKSEMRKYFNQSKNNSHVNNGYSLGKPFSSSEILPDEDMSRRGFKKYSGFSPDLVARVESRVSTIR